MNVLITGGKGDIGSAIVQKFQANKHIVYAPSSKELDLSSDKSIDNYLMNIQNIDIFIHCAGINNPQDFDSLSLYNINNTMNINTFSAVKILKYLLPIMQNKQYGRIVLVSSLWSQQAKKGRIAYAMSKSALDSLTRGIAIEYGKDNILINSVLPGFIDTKLTRKNLSKTNILEIKNHTPLNTLGNPLDVAEVVYFLSNKNNNFVTGQSLKVDGGYTL
jgi:3-oxoacyl-[acyl-carrier protein] reductase